MREKPKGCQISRITRKSKLDERHDEINSDLKKGLNLTNISKLTDCNRQTSANWTAGLEL